MLLLTTILISTALACPPTDGPSPKSPLVAVGAVAERPIVELAICLDTSGSMNGLIDAARARLWDIVNELALAQPTPTLRVALLTFGNNGHAPEAGWVKVDIGFTEDLDEVSKQLFALTTNGGEEYVGRVLAAAESQLTWTKPGESASSPSLLQIVVVAGNESADQDQQISFRDACKALVSRGITVNSIYCGSPGDQLAPDWREVATLADGHFAAIDQSHGALAIATPFDDELARLGAEINVTYLAYGPGGGSGAWNQTAQDSNAQALNSAVAAQRAQSKASALYDCGHWDLVDACGSPDFKLESVKDEDLPEAMRKMTPEERKAHIAALTAKREEFKKQIAELGAKRQLFVAEAQKEAAAEGKQTFGAAMLKAVREKGTAKGLKWEVGCEGKGK